MTIGTVLWIIFICLVGLGVSGLLVYNVRSLFKKWKAYPSNWFDLLVGIVMFAGGTLVMWGIIIKYILSQIPA